MIATYTAPVHASGRDTMFLTGCVLTHPAFGTLYKADADFLAMPREFRS